MAALRKAGHVKAGDPLKFVQILREVIDVEKIEKLLLVESNPILRALILEQMQATYASLADDWSRVRSTFDDTVDEAVDKSSKQIKTAGPFKDRLITRLRSNPQATADELTRMIRKEFGFYREAGARRIAETTATAATGKAQNAAFEPFDGTARWLTRRDTKRRRDHANADGQKKKDGYYRVGGSRMEHPGDPSAPARQVVRCRCSQFFQKE